MIRRYAHRLILLLVTLLLTRSVLLAQESPINPDAPDAYIRAPRLGITFISSAQIHRDELDRRYQHALELGAGWNRFPIYWDLVEREAGALDWAAYDQVIAEDLRYGLQINAILLGIPGHHRDGDRPAGLNEPIFSDGTDSYRDGKTINPNNPWALFVSETVRRYMPGGTLSVEHQLAPGQGIRMWEIWNEPDFPAFWSGSVRDYARLLKTAYIVIHALDPQAQVMFGGLIYNDPRGVNWLAQVLAILSRDPQHQQNNFYMDAVAVHNYNYAWRSGWLVRYVRETLRAYAIERPIWLNESGAAVWDDYPGPTWITDVEEHPLRLTMEEQAWFFIQSTAYAWVEGAQVVFFHQLYDDCGNQPPGTNFPPHEGELCPVEATAEPDALPTAELLPGSVNVESASIGLCYGDSFGIFRNESNALCFSRHPDAGSPRPVAQAFRLMAEVFGVSEITAARYMVDPRLLILNPTPEATEDPSALPTATPTPDPDATAEPDAAPSRPRGPLMGDGSNVVIRFDLASGATVYVVWNETDAPITLELPASRTDARVRSLDGDTVVAAEPGRALEGRVYRVTLSPAVPNGYPFLARGETSSVGGAPLIIFEGG